MPQWLRNLVMITGLGAWLAIVVVSLIRGQLPDAMLLGFPAGLVLALAPPAIGRNRDNNSGDGPAPPAGGGSE